MCNPYSHLRLVFCRNPALPPPLPCIKESHPPRFFSPQPTPLWKGIQPFVTEWDGLVKTPFSSVNSRPPKVRPFPPHINLWLMKIFPPTTPRPLICVVGCFFFPFSDESLSRSMDLSLSVYNPLTIFLHGVTG